MSNSKKHGHRSRRGGKETVGAYIEPDYHLDALFAQLEHERYHIVQSDIAPPPNIVFQSAMTTGSIAVADRILNDDIPDIPPRSVAFQRRLATVADYCKVHPRGSLVPGKVRKIISARPGEYNHLSVLLDGHHILGLAYHGCNPLSVCFTSRNPLIRKPEDLLNQEFLFYLQEPHPAKPYVFLGIKRERLKTSQETLSRLQHQLTTSKHQLFVDGQVVKITYQGAVINFVVTDIIGDRGIPVPFEGWLDADELGFNLADLGQRLPVVVTGIDPTQRTPIRLSRMS